MIRRDRIRLDFFGLCVFMLIAAQAGSRRAEAAEPEKSLEFRITRTDQIHPDPLSTRIYVFLGTPGAPRPPRMGPNFLNPSPFFAVDVNDWKAGEPAVIGANSVGYPTELGKLKPGKYAIQAVVRLNPDTHELGTGEGNAYGESIVAELDPEKPNAIDLKVDTIVPPKPFKETDRIKLVDIPSPLLSAFYGRPMRMRGAVISPKGSTIDQIEKRPSLYIIPGFGGDHHMAAMFERTPRLAFGREFVRIVLDPDCGTGHHVFADSATNGPRGEALVKEFIPYIEAHFPVIADPRARLLTGHSSGGWSSLWLQVAYPDTFGGVWSTSPDPVDFRRFQTIDIYAPRANAFKNDRGESFPVARINLKPVMYYEQMSKVEDATGPGGQLGSFEAVFSPRGDDGNPLKLWDRKTGAIDPAVAKAWEKYDIRLKIERSADELLPKLKGKLHVITGEDDTFYLEDAVKRLDETLKRLGSDAHIEVIPGKDHGNLLDDKLAERIEAEMTERVADFLPKQTQAK